MHCKYIKGTLPNISSNAFIAGMMVDRFVKLKGAWILIEKISNKYYIRTYIYIYIYIFIQLCSPLF